MSTGGLSHPTVLPFSLVSYDGSRDDDENDTPIENVLSEDRDLYHCSRDGHNFNLLLQYTPSIAAPSASCTLTHVIIHGPASCTAPIATGIVFASLDAPDIAAYSSKYDDLTREQYEQLPLSTLQADGAIAYFTLTDLDHLQIPVTLPSWTECRYLHIKLLTARSAVDDANIDIERIAAIGFDTAQRPFEEVTLPSTIPQQLGLIREELTRWNRVSHDHMRALREQPACILFGSDPMKAETTAARTLLYGIAMSGKYDSTGSGGSDSVTFFYYDDSSSEKEFGEALAEMAGLAPPNQRPPVSIVITDTTDDTNNTHRRYHYTGPLDDLSLRSWIDAYLAGSLTPFVKSEPRPAGDVDAKHNKVTVVTASSFDELVSDANSTGTNVLLFVTWVEDNLFVSAMARCWMYALADVLSEPQLRIASFDSDNNDVPAAIPSDARPGIVLFPAHHQQAAVTRLRELPTPQSLPRFLHKHLPSLVTEEDVEALSRSPRLEAAFAYTSLLLDSQRALQDSEAAIETMQGALTTEEQHTVQQLIDTLSQALLALATEGADDLTLQTDAQAVLQAVEAELGKHQQLIDEVEAAKALMDEVGESLRGARAALSDEEFNKLAEAIAYVSFALPRDKPEQKSQSSAVSTNDSKQSSESEAQQGDEDGEAEAARLWQQAKAAPFSKEKLQATVDKLRQVGTATHVATASDSARAAVPSAYAHSLCVVRRVLLVGFRRGEGQAGGQTSRVGSTVRRPSSQMSLRSRARSRSHCRHSRSPTDRHRFHSRLVRAMQSRSTHLRSAESRPPQRAAHQS